MNIYFFGGSFDPPHRGHLKMLQSCINDSHLFVLIPVSQSPFKDKVPVASKNQRIQMLELFTEKLESYIVIDNWEINQSGPSYTYETVRHLQKKYPGCNLSMVVGADQLISFEKWKNYGEIMNSVRIVGFNRDQSQFIPLNGMQISWREDFQVDISSSVIQDKIDNGRIPTEDLTPEIIEFIQENKLYGYQV